MRTAFVYYSQYHGNIKKLLNAIVNMNLTVTLINAAEKIEVDLRNYNRSKAETIRPRKRYRAQLSFFRDCRDNL